MEAGQARWSWVVGGGDGSIAGAGRKGIGLITGVRTGRSGGSVDELCSDRWSGRRECVVAEFAEDVVGAAAEFSRD